MIKITKEGKIKNHYIMIYNAECPMCHCEFEFTLDECNSVERRINGNVTINCPYCKHNITLINPQPIRGEMLDNE